MAKSKNDFDFKELSRQTRLWLAYFPQFHIAEGNRLKLLWKNFGVDLDLVAPSILEAWRDKKHD